MARTTLARLNITVEDKLENEFRLEVARRLGFKKGTLQKAMEQALRLWIDQGKKKER